MIYLEYCMSMKININNISGSFLIASPSLDDPNFRQSVVLICEHSRDGAFGLIINKILMNSFVPLRNAFDIKSTLVDLPVYYGGPVRPEQGYVLYSPFDPKYGSVKVSGDVAVTASREMLYEIAEGKGPEKFMFALGFSGWIPNQLEDELMTDSWLVAPLDQKIIFELPVKERWKYAANSIGVDFERFVDRSGSA